MRFKSFSFNFKEFLIFHVLIFRYGDPKFKKWHSKLIATVESKASGLSVDFQEYFCSSFGNPLRLDYGTGHELNFICSL